MMKKTLLCFLLLLFSTLTVGSEIESYLKQGDLSTRLYDIAASFLGKPYQVNALGEGGSGRYDQNPLYRFDVFDCQTYVETVLALAYANDAASFEEQIRKIRYQQGKVGYLSRNHFMSLDWHTNNAHLFKDVTDLKMNGADLTQKASAIIDKKSWINHKTIKDIILSHASDEEKFIRLEELKNKAVRLKPQKVTIDYLPLTALFNEQKEPNQALFDKIPDAAIVEIIRPNWHLKDTIGTNLHISHLGFVFRRNGDLMFFNASSLAMKVNKPELAMYLKSYLDSATVKGIKILLPIPA